MLSDPRFPKNWNLLGDSRSLIMVGVSESMPQMTVAFGRSIRYLFLFELSGLIVVDLNRCRCKRRANEIRRPN